MMMTHLGDFFTAQTPERPPVAGRVVSALTSAGLSIAVAESLTGGLISGALTAIPGASGCVLGGVVTYATASKEHVLNVPGDVLRAHGPVHSTTAAAMARHVRMLFGADIGVASTGVAGPDPLDGVPPGVVFVAADMHGGPAQVRRLQLPGGRIAVRTQAVNEALDLALSVLAQREAWAGNVPQMGADGNTAADI